MKYKASQATVEELITDIVNHEDPDQVLQVSHDGNGTISVWDPEWRIIGEGRTFREALIAYGKLRWSVDGEMARFDYE